MAESDQQDRQQVQGQVGQSRVSTWPVPAIGRAIAPLSTGILSPLSLTVGAWLQAEAGPGRLMLWAPVAFGAGIAAYFTAEHEPVVSITMLTASALCAVAFAARKHPIFSALMMLAAVASGFATATFKTARIAHTVLMRPIYSASLTGFVETREVRERTDRFVMRVATMESSRDQTKIERVRLSVKKGTAPAVGSFVALKARLLPPLSPLLPGSYDFGRDMFFQGIGASGFAMGSIKTLEAPRTGGFYLWYVATAQAMRDAIDARIRSALSGDARAIATALLTGRRDAISTPVNDAMFISGLGHVLSISGYHMAVVAGVVFFAVRALLALFPMFVVTRPIKKWAAAAALAASAFYLLLSGAEVATQRSFFMTATILIAVMADRRAITFRTLAVAAMIVLVVAPEALVHPSFQMSFAATLGLVVLVQIGMPRLFATTDSSPAARAALWGGREIVTLTLASLVAGLGTMPYAAYHFHRITPYGVLANLAAMPVVSGLVMPAGLLGLVAMPFGFDGFFWRLMDVGIGWMVAVSQWVAALPGAIGRVAAFGTGPLLGMSLGLVLFGLLRTPLRWTGAGVLVLSVVWAMAAPLPDILVAGDGHSVAVRGRDGRLHLMHTAKDSFQTREWLAADGDVRGADDASLAVGVSCDDSGCVTAAADGSVVALTLKPEAFADDCQRAAVIVTLRQPPGDCRALTLDRNLLQRRGALALRKQHEGYTIAAMRPEGVDRPWSPATGEAEGMPTSTTRNAVSPQPADATPAESDLQPDD